MIHSMDGSKMALRWPLYSGTGSQIIAANVKKAPEADRIIVEVDGNLLLIPLRKVKCYYLYPLICCT